MTVSTNPTITGVLLPSGTAATSFIQLTDAPNSYAGNAHKVVRVATGEVQLEFSTPVSSFTQLSDVPANYTGQGGKLVGVAAGETTLEFVNKDRTIPKSATVSGTLTSAEVGKCIPATNNITIANNVFAPGDVVSIYNTTGGNISLIQGSGVTLVLSGTATTGTRTIAQNGLVTIWFSTTSVGVCVGSGLT